MRLNKIWSGDPEELPDPTVNLDLGDAPLFLILLSFVTRRA